MRKAKMKFGAAVIMGAIMVFIMMPVVLAAETADYVFINGDIYTVNPEHPSAQALAVKGNKIIFVGNNTEAKAYIGNKTHVADLKGRMVLPGFIETHSHFAAGAAVVQGVQLTEARNYNDIIRILEEYAKENPGTGLVRGFGWKPSYFPPTGPAKEDLDRIFGNRPVEIFEISGHSTWVNSKAFEIAGITPETPAPQPGFSYYMKNDKGELSGLVVELAAEAQIWNKLQPFDRDYVMKGLESWLPKFAAAGITAAFDSGFITFQDQAEGFMLLQDLEKEGRLPVRVTGSFYTNNPAIDNLGMIEDYRQRFHSNLVKAKMLKINVDGEPTSRSSGVFEPYEGTDSLGETIFNSDQLSRLVTEADLKGIPTHAHAMGDRALSMYLDAVAAARKANGPNGPTHSVAHTYMIAEKDFPRFHDLNVVASFAGHWLQIEDAMSLVRVLGKNRAANYQRMGSVNDAGGTVALGADWPVSGSISSYKTLDMIETAHTRKPFGQPEIEALPPLSDRMSIPDLIEAATINGAYMLGMEDQIGSLREGKLADLIVLDKSLFKVPDHEIHKIKILLTMMDGKIRHGSIEQASKASTIATENEILERGGTTSQLPILIKD